jgi:hypothetical protein
MDLLVGGIPTPLKNINQWEGLSHILWKNGKCSKPPTRIYQAQQLYFR